MVYQAERKDEKSSQEVSPKAASHALEILMMGTETVLWSSLMAY